MTKHADRPEKRIVNYDPHLVEFFRAASQREVRLRFTTKGEAVKARQRLYTCRKTMRKEHHHLVNVAEQVEIGLEQGLSTPTGVPDGSRFAGDYFVIGRPVDSGGLVEAIRAAGVELPGPDDDSDPAPDDPLQKWR